MLFYCRLSLLWSPSEKENRKYNIWDLCHLFCTSVWCVFVFSGTKNIFPGKYVVWEIVVRFLGLSPRFNSTEQTNWLWPAELLVYFTLITLGLNKGHRKWLLSNVLHATMSQQHLSPYPNPHATQRGRCEEFFKVISPTRTPVFIFSSCSAFFSNTCLV